MKYFYLNNFYEKVKKTHIHLIKKKKEKLQLHTRTLINCLLSQFWLIMSECGSK